jgi:acetyl esterase
MSGLDTEAQALLEVMEAAGAPPIEQLTVAQARERMKSAFATRGAPLALAEVRDLELPSPHGPLGIRLYRPRQGELPLALFLHGGGWTVNDVDTHDEVCRRLAYGSGWMLASLEYRRAPEHKHPAALQDAYVAWRWLRDNSDRLGAAASPSAVIGESAGGSTAAALALMLRDGGGPMPEYQVLVYPMMDRPDSWPSYTERGHGYMLDRPQIDWFVRQFLADGHDLSDPCLFPLLAEDLTELPPTLLVSAEFDPLRDEGVAFARKLSEAGVTVQHIHAVDQMHGFLLLGRAVRKAGELIDRIAGALAARAEAR